MRISRSVYPILQLIEQKKLNLSRYEFKNNLSNFVLRDTINEELEKKCESGEKFLRSFNSQNYKISFFAKSVTQKVETIFKKMESLQKELPECKGVFLMPDETVFFYEYKDQELTILHIWKDRFYGFGTMSFKQQPLPSGENLMIDMIPTPKIVDNKLYFGEDYGNGLIFNHILGYLLFYHLVETEVVVLSSEKGFKKKTAIDNIEYVSESKIRIEIVDSSWFKTIIRTEGFGVNGHFRLQPFGEGSSLRKVIWVDGYEKNGYRIKSKMESRSIGSEDSPEK